MPTRAVRADLERLLPRELVVTSSAVLEAHGKDESYPDVMLPDVVVFAESREHVAAVMRYASANRVPVTPFAVGSSLEGHALPRFGGISLDVSRMNEVLQLRPHDLLAVVQPGVTYPALNKQARGHGLFFPVDPGAEASLGGMAATNASGTNAVRYGTMRELVLGLEVVLPSGEVIRTGGKARKSSSGLDLTRLFVGSEGTLGVFTELTLRLVGLPVAILGATVNFPDVTSAVQAAVSVIQSGIPIARIELLDEGAIACVNAYKNLNLPVMPTLFLEFHGSAGSVLEDAKLTRELCEHFDGQGFQHALEPEKRAKLWEARHHTYWALRAAYPGKTAFSTDVAVPLSKLPEAVRFAQELLEELRLVGPIIGHVGDGNFHTLVCADRDDPDEWNRAQTFNSSLVKHALSLEGTATGEHGVGIRKQAYMRLEHGAALETMRALKHAIDPLGVMNPGKLVDERSSWDAD
jgi:D-lactate dehydrogenase (cytochrome)